MRNGQWTTGRIFSGVLHTLAQRAEWESTGGIFTRWLIFFACLLIGPICMVAAVPSGGIPLVLATSIFWIWWSTPFLRGWNNTGNQILILLVLSLHIAALVALWKRH